MSRKWVLVAVMLSVAGAAFAEDKNELAYRAALGRGDDVKLLIKQGANPNATNPEGVPVLLIAASRKDVEALAAVQALLEGGANVNVKDSAGQTALYYAARSGKADVVDYLLKNKIDYYSLDKNGDIARTIAFRLGHTDIVKLMDDYVKNQTIAAQTIYKNAQDLVSAQQKKEAEEAARAAAEEKKREAAEAEKQRRERERQLKEYQENLKKLDDKVYNMSYNACAFQYWSFTQAADQTTVLTEEETDEVIENHRQAVREVALEVMKMFNVGQNYVNRVINPSKQMIFNQLNAMPSRTYRKENGVGTLADVDTRCGKIAESWVITAPGKKPAAVAKPAAAKPVPAKKAEKTYPGQVQLQKVGSAAAR